MLTVVPWFAFCSQETKLNQARAELESRDVQTQKQRDELRREVSSWRGLGPGLFCCPIYESLFVESIDLRLIVVGMLFFSGRTQFSIPRVPEVCSPRRAGAEMTGGWGRGSVPALRERQISGTQGRFSIETGGRSSGETVGSSLNDIAV